MTLDEPEIELLSGADGQRLRLDLGRRALAEHAEMIQGKVVARLEREQLARLALELREPGAGGADENPRDRGGELDLDGFRARLRGQAAEVPLGLDRVRLLRDDYAVARANRAARRSGSRADRP